ncbi:MAG: sensor histidine kinase [Hyphomicrobium sp.]
MTALFDRLAKPASTTAFRLTAIAVCSFLVAAGLLAALLFWQTNKVLTDQAVATLRSEAQILQAKARDDGVDALARTIQTLARPDGDGLYLLIGPDGATRAGNLNQTPPELLETPSGGVFNYNPGGAGAARLAVAIPVDIGPSHRLYVGRDIEEQRAFADSIKRTFLIGFGALSLFGLLAGLAVSRLILKRMDQITATSRSIMAGDMSQRIPLAGDNGELDGLAKNLNDMLERIEGLMNGLREVSDNIAHDLKTPLNRLRNAAEAALRDHSGEAAYREGLEGTIEKADELIKTFNALLLIARLEAGPLEDSLERFDLGKLIEDVSELYMPAAEEAGFALTVAAASGVIVRANKQLIGQATSNLIDNAIKYARGGEARGPILVTVARTAGGVDIAVADRGPGISSADRARVLKRFVRLEESRTKPGTGLGLSLVAAVARLHHGEVRIEDNAPGLKVVLALSNRVLVDPPAPARDERRPVAAG